MYSPSAEVRGHGSGDRILQTGKKHVNISAVEPVGNYAIKLTFDDGHDTGIYTWEYLRELGEQGEARWATYSRNSRPRMPRACRRYSSVSGRRLPIEAESARSSTMPQSTARTVSRTMRPEHGFARRHQRRHASMTDPKDTPSTVDFGYEQVPIEDKVRRVGDVFRSVAPKYDVMNDLMSLGTHRILKRMTIELSGVRPGHRVLDLAGGTGDLSLLFAHPAWAETARSSSQTSIRQCSNSDAIGCWTRVTPTLKP